MQKMSLIVENLSKEQLSKHEKNHPPIVWQVEEKGKGEGFNSYVYHNCVYLKGKSYQGAAYGISQLSIAWESGYLANFTGDRAPRYPLRPAWLGSQESALITQNMCLALPFINFDSQSVMNLSQRILELGLNAVVLGTRDSIPHFNGETDVDLKNLCELFHECGIKVILKPHFAIPEQLARCPLNPQFHEWLSTQIKTLIKKVPNFDFFFWESHYLHRDFITHPKAHTSTLLELILDEAKFFEGLLKPNHGFIHFIPTPDENEAQQQAQWMVKFCERLGPQSYLAFSAVSGHFYANHLSPHPLWEKLFESEVFCSAPLLPIFNFGYVQNGEGLWPALCLETLERYASHLQHSSLGGVITVVNFFPKKGTLLDCNLWVASQMSWSQLSPEMLASTWFKAHLSDWNYTEIVELMRLSHQIVLELSYLRSKTLESSRDSVSSDECRILTDSLFARLKQLQLKCDKQERKRLKKNIGLSFSDYLPPFIKDAQRIILYFLQCYNLSFPNQTGSEDSGGFWTQHSQGQGHGIRSSSKVIFLEKPFKGPTGSRMEAVYLEHYGSAASYGALPQTPLKDANVL